MDLIEFAKERATSNVLNSGVYEPIKIHGFEKQAFKLLEGKESNIFLKSRQMFMTTMLATYCAWLLLEKLDIRIVYMSNSLAASKNFMNRVREFLSPYTSKEDFVSNASLKIMLKNSYGILEAVSASPIAGRGYTIDVAILDEMAYFNRQEDIWTAISFAVSQVQGKIVIASTPFERKDKFEKLWNKTNSGELDFIPMKLHWSENPFYTPERIHEIKQSLGYDQEKIDNELEMKFKTPKTKEQERINFRVDTELYEKLKKNAMSKGKNMSEYIRGILESAV